MTLRRPDRLALDRHLRFPQPLAAWHTVRRHLNGRGGARPWSWPALTPAFPWHSKGFNRPGALVRSARALLKSRARLAAWAIAILLSTRVLHVRKRAQETPGVPGD